MPYQLSNEQHRMVEHIVNHPYNALFVPMGMGKTAASLASILMLRLLGEYNGPTLVIAPLRVACTTWPDEIDSPNWPEFNTLKYSVVTGKINDRKKAVNTEADIYIVNLENLPWLAEYHSYKWPYKNVIVDECTKLKGFRLRQGTRRAAVLGAKRKEGDIDRMTLLTGTPAPNGLQDLWATGWFIDKGERLGYSYSAFENRWFRRKYTGFGIEPLPNAQREIEDKLRDVCLTIEPTVKDEPIENTIYVDLPEEARKQYDKMERDMFLQLNDDFEDTHDISAVNAAGRSLKCLQIANGCVYSDAEISNSRDYVQVHNEKIHALESVIEEAAGMPVLVVYKFKTDMKRIKTAFPTAKVLTTGNVKKNVDAWNRGEIPILLVHPQSAGHGLSLQHGSNIMCFFSLDWNLEEHLQVIERIGPMRQKQAGYNRPVYTHYIQARNTIDDLVRKRLKTKKSVQDILLEALKEKEL